ncbi:MAG TPA: MBL fold metallo-hydrolase, partial [Gemmatimonadaceae bacterium]|nr:MBL fold metallo-hydrolase [Gemmatimonadaceae bacterium]
MLLKRFYDTKLAQASYLVGCSTTGEALVVDANRDIDQYIEGAEVEGLRIAHISETHIHADFVSGSRELAARTGAKLYLSAEGGPDWLYRFADAAGATLIRNGEEFHVGRVRIEALHTPGHTPEHLSFVLTDTAATDLPMGAFTGDFVFVGDVGRPDLLERAVNVTGSMEEAARTLFDSLQRFRALPDYLQLWPAHGAGSACGKALGAVPQTTLGYEKIANWAFGVRDVEEFVRLVLAGQPDPPAYFSQMKRINRDGPRLLGGRVRPEREAETRLRTLLESKAIIVDTRPAADYAAGHLTGTINIPLNRSFTTWAGWLLPYDRDLYLIADRRCTNCVDDAVRDLVMIGLDRVVGYFGSEVLDTWVAEGGTLATIPQMSADELRRRIEDDEVRVIDVRARSEWEEGNLPGSENIHLGELAR